MSEEYKYKLAQSSAFKKDLKSLSEDEKNETKEVIRKLAKDEQLEEKYHDHQLLGKLKDFRDCHIRPDLVLIYRIKENILELYLYRIGTHSKLYKK
ncbi:MAG: type II toxin-antitoxin system YafQ family toxin [Spirochaetaceae bacterium]|nr:type II toxin-antitoxin system YafQ family toxin [Spirochaetaceae bacterium]MBR4823650.1 type II toxin-antitoxin system YafQ family toxin [Spirochaetaceae bacterium]